MDSKKEDTLQGRIDKRLDEVFDNFFEHYVGKQMPGQEAAGALRHMVFQFYKEGARAAHRTLAAEVRQLSSDLQQGLYKESHY